MRVPRITPSSTCLRRRQQTRTSTATSSLMWRDKVSAASSDQSCFLFLQAVPISNGSSCGSDDICVLCNIRVRSSVPSNHSARRQRPPDTRDIDMNTRLVLPRAPGQFSVVPLRQGIRCRIMSNAISTQRLRLTPSQCKAKRLAERVTE